MSTLEATAFHEAGHAVIAVLTGRAVSRVSVVPQDDALGHVRYLTSLINEQGFPESALPLDTAEEWERATEWEKREATRRLRAEGRLRAAILACLAGPLAEAIHTDSDQMASVGAEQDRETAADIALHLAGGGEAASALLDERIHTVFGMLAEPHDMEGDRACGGRALNTRVCVGSPPSETCEGRPLITRFVTRLYRQGTTWYAGEVRHRRPISL